MTVTATTPAATAVTATTPAVVRPGTVPATEHEPGCEVCPHPLADHDAIGLRFCRATSSGGLDRGCACR
jgi:hypothetical protein